MRNVLLAAVALGAAGIAYAEVTMQPGEWETTIRMTEMNMPNLPPQVAASMAGRTMTVKTCVSADDLTKTPEKVFAGSKGNCTAKQNKFAGGVVDMDMTCKGGMHGHTVGTYTATSYTATSEMTLAGGCPSKSTVSGKLLGPCSK